MTRRGPSKRRRARRIVLIVVLIMGCGIGVAIWVGYQRARQAPEWYAPPAVSEEVVQLADDAEYALVAEAQAIRPADELWSVRIRDEQINAWLAARLPEWLAHEGSAWPDALGVPQAMFEPGRIRLAIPLDQSQGGPVISLGLRPWIENQRLRIEPERVWMGQLGIPGEPILQLAGLLERHVPNALADPQVAEWIGRLQDDAGFALTTHLADDRAVEVMDLRVGDGVLDVQCRTLLDKHAPPGTDLAESLPEHRDQIGQGSVGDDDEG